MGAIQAPMSLSHGIGLRRRPLGARALYVHLRVTGSSFLFLLFPLCLVTRALITSLPL